MLTISKNIVKVDLLVNMAVAKIIISTKINCDLEVFSS